MISTWFLYDNGLRHERVKLSDSATSFFALILTNQKVLTLWYECQRWNFSSSRFIFIREAQRVRKFNTHEKL